MAEIYTVACWNIAGGRTVRSLEHFDYGKEDVSYFANHLDEVSPNVVCFQESHSNKQRVLAAEIAQVLGMSHVYDKIVSPSHIDANYSLSNAIISKNELHHVEDVAYPYPSFGHTFADGRPAAHHDKIIQIYQDPRLGTHIANTQMLPLGIFGKRYNTGEGAELASQIDQALLEHLPSPLILCADFNYSYPAEIYPRAYRSLSLSEALPDVLTRPNAKGHKETPDHIAVSEHFAVIRAEVIPTQTDHYLCVAELALSNS